MFIVKKIAEIGEGITIVFGVNVYDNLHFELW
jgi:hypothetical protein